MSTNRPPSPDTEERRRGVLTALRGLGGEAAPADLAAVTGVAPRTLSRDIDALARAGLVGGTKHRRHLTPTGWEQLSAATLPVPTSSFDDAIGDVFSPYHAAFARLLMDAVVARHVFPSRRWAPGFAACGSPGRGKTAIAAFTCWALGLDSAVAIRHMAQLSPGEVVGRRRQVDGGGWTLERSSLIDLPFACLDEWAEADPPVRKEALQLIHGETVALIEGDRIELRPTVLLTYNPAPGGDPRRPLPPPYWRRCIAFHPDTAGPDPGLAGRLHRFDTEQRPPAVRLDLATGAIQHVPDEARPLIDGSTTSYHQVLTDSGRLHYGDVRTAETLVLGRLARHGVGPGDDARAITWHVAYDLLTVAETIDGHVIAGWRLAADEVRSYLVGAPGAEQFADAVERHEAAQDARRADADQRRRTHDEQGLALVGRRAELAEWFKAAATAIQRVSPEHRPRAAGLRKQLRTLAEQVGEARSARALDDLAELGTGIVSEATELRQALDDIADAERRRQQAATDREKAASRAAVAQRAASKKANDEWQRQQKRMAAERRRRAAPLRKLLERKTTRPDEDVPSRLVELGVVQPVDEHYQVDARSRLDEWLKKPPRWVWRTHRRFRAIDGSLYERSHLATWQEPAVRSALTSAIDVIERGGAPDRAVLGAGDPVRRAVAALPPGNPAASVPYTDGANFGRRLL